MSGDSAELAEVIAKWRKKRGNISSMRQASGYAALSHERVEEREDVEKVEKGKIKSPGWSLVETVGIGVGWGPRSPRADLWSNTRMDTEVSIPFLALPQGVELGTGLASPPRFHMRQAVGRMPLTDCLHQVDQVCHEPQISGSAVLQGGFCLTGGGDKDGKN